VQPETAQPRTSQPTELDGRRARRGRNREAVVDALLELFREGVLSPSVATVAERSGVSLRSVFRYFDDLDEMGRIAIARHTENVQHLFPLAKIGEGNREDRIQRLVDHRIALYDAVAPVVRATMLRAPFQPVVAAGLAERRAYLRDQIDEQFAPELAILPDTDRFVVATAADALTSFETLEVLRVDRALPLLRCGTVMRGALDRLLPGS
jgi:AcrR family transcriptional regulator